MFVLHDVKTVCGFHSAFTRGIYSRQNKLEITQIRCTEGHRPNFFGNAKLVQYLYSFYYNYIFVLKFGKRTSSELTLLIHYNVICNYLKHQLYNLQLVMRMKQITNSLYCENILSYIWQADPSYDYTTHANESKT